MKTLALAKQLLAGVALGVALAGLYGCAFEDGLTTRDNEWSRTRIGPDQLTPEQIQSQVMSFADTYCALMKQAFDELSLDDPSLETRRLAVNGRRGFIGAAIEIATGRNAVTALLDMTVMVSLQRRAWEEYWRPNLFPKNESIGEMLAQLDREIWEINEGVLTDTQQDALRSLILQIKERYPQQVYVSSIRASEYAAQRRDSLVQIQGGANLLTLFGLDPFAKLSPTTRQLAESRQLGERAFFFATRAPTLLSWHFEDALLDFVGEPETQRAIAAVEQASDAGQRAAAVAEQLSDQLSDERTAAIDQLADRFTAEREAAINQMADRLAIEREAAITQMFDGVTAERDVWFDRLEGEQSELRGTLVEVRGTLDATDLPCSVTLVTNQHAESARVESRSIGPYARDPGSTRPLELAWPPGVISLSHVALPFAPDDPVYGQRPPESNEFVFLGQLALQGERGLLSIPPHWMFRLRYNPFYEYVERRSLEWMDEADENSALMCVPGRTVVSRRITRPARRRSAPHEIDADRGVRGRTMSAWYVLTDLAPPPVQIHAASDLRVEVPSR